MSVLFRSTRDDGNAAPVGFQEALFRGLAPDGGLYVPVTIPPLPGGWREVGSFPELAELVLSNWLADAGLGRAGFRDLLEDAFDFEVPLRRLSGDRWLLELHHGPTLAFKDFGARFMARVMDALLQQAGRRLTIITATSGDTGSAVAAAFAGLSSTDVVLLYPAGRVSPLQELQLIVERPGVSALRVAGTFDDGQRMAKEVLSDPEVQSLGVSSANSINIGRLLPQQLYYLWALRQLPAGAAPVFVVPSGNLGNLTAGVYAQLAGAGSAGFVAAHNANDWFPRWLAGTVEPFDFPATVQTLSNAMDVGAPSNFERLHALGGQLEGLVDGYGVSDSAVLERMALTWSEDGVLVCPHTAVGLEAAARHRAAGHDGPAVILATAAAAKFPEVVAEAVPGADATAEPLEQLRKAPVRVTDIPAGSSQLKQFLLSR